MTDSLIRLRDALREFAAERDWEQFHSPRNLAAARAKIGRNAARYPVEKSRGSSWKYDEL